MTEYSKVILAFAILLLSTLPSQLKGNPIIIEDIILVQETCLLDNGQITIVVQGNPTGLEYSIDGGLNYFSSNHFENLDSKDYLILVRDGNLCTEVYTTQIADAGFPELKLEAECLTGLNRSIVTPTVEGGSTPYVYEWLGPNGSEFDTEKLAEALPGIYYLTITDNLGCSFSDSITISQCCSLDLTCNLEDETYNCINSIPLGDPLLSNPITSESTRYELLEDLGISVKAGACGPINVQIVDTANNPTDCDNDTLKILREYIISDAHNDIVCSQSYSITNYIEASIISEAKDAVISCEMDIESEYQLWLSNMGGFDFQACSDPIIISTIPATPILDPSCGVKNNVTFIVEDGCGNSVESSASFVVQDEISPLILCPEKLILFSTESEVDNTVESWLEEISISDNCSVNLALSNDFEADLTDLCSIQDPIEVAFKVSDNCSNTSNCISTIEVINTMPELSCPDDLIIDCGSNVSDILSQWAAEVVATQNNDNTISNDLNEDLATIVCSESQTILFHTMDDCENRAECTATITISDDQIPEIICPNELSIDIFDTDNKGSIEDWLETVIGTDCNAITLSNDLDIDIESITCSETIPVNFTAVDFCGLTNSCSSSIRILNDATIGISCPESLTLLCTQPDLLGEIANHISQVTITAQNAYEVFEDYDHSLIDIACEDPTTIEISMSAVDICDKEVECRTAINIIPDPAIYIPNVFSPDGDGLNDYFTAYTNTSVKSIKSMIIYNRWGSKIFEKSEFPPNDAYEGWDGTYRKKNEKTDVFTFYFVLEDTFGQEIEKVGTIQILRK